MNSSLLSYALYAIPIVLIVAIVVFAAKRERKRIEGLKAVAAKRGFTFAPATDHELTRAVKTLPGFDHQGRSNERAFAVFSGTHRGRAVKLFDFCYDEQMTSVGSDGVSNQSTTTTARHLALVSLERALPTTAIRPEGLGSKIAKVFGRKDINFDHHPEAAEFSRRFFVKCDDEAFAKDLCDMGFCRFLLEHPGTWFEIAGNQLAVIHDGYQSPEKIEAELSFAIDLRQRMPAKLVEA